MGFLHERRNSLGSVSGHGNGKKKLDTKLHIEFPDGRTDAKRICMKFSGEQVWRQYHVVVVVVVLCIYLYQLWCCCC